MTYRTLLCFSLLLTYSTTALAQASKEFPEAQCKYALPNSNWQWVDPQLVPHTIGKTLACAKNPRGFVFILINGPLRPGEQPTAETFAGFEAGFLKTSKATRVDGTESTFRRISTDQFEVELPDRTGGAVRIMYANDSIYILQALHAKAALSAADADAIFQSFDFIGQPKPAMRQDLPAGMMSLVVRTGVAMIAAGLILFVVFSIKSLIKKQGTRVNPIV
jgi:hypothetical protein